MKIQDPKGNGKYEKSSRKILGVLGSWVGFGGLAALGSGVACAFIGHTPVGLSPVERSVPGGFQAPPALAEVPKGAHALADFSAFSRRVFRTTETHNLPVSVFESMGTARLAEQARRISKFCERVDVEFRALGWGESPCGSLRWNFDRTSERGIPLVYWEFNGLGSDRDTDRKDETTLVLGGVHPDEITPIHLAFRFAQELERNPGIFADRRVIVAPLVNPDGFFVKPYRRTNANGVDLNRNFATRDWWPSATRLWHARRQADPRHFPGFSPHTEEGTRFQVDLLERYDVDKVVSIHSPLGFLDYDGPGDTKTSNLSRNEKRAREFASLVSRSSNNYEVKDFTFYPGSLGNYSGNERYIPTVTLEMQSTNPKLSQRYWVDFFPGLVAAVKFDFTKNALARADGATTTLNR
jgi:protein MpaA